MYSNTCFTINYIENKIPLNITDGHRKVTGKRVNELAKDTFKRDHIDIL